MHHGITASVVWSARVVGIACRAAVDDVASSRLRTLVCHDDMATTRCILCAAVRCTLRLRISIGGEFAVVRAATGVVQMLHSVATISMRHFSLWMPRLKMNWEPPAQMVLTRGLPDSKSGDPGHKNAFQRIPTYVRVIPLVKILSLQSYPGEVTRAKRQLTQHTHTQQRRSSHILSRI